MRAHLGQLFAQRREELGKNQEEIAKLVHISAQDLGGYERGTRRLSFAMAEAITEALGLSRDAFLVPLRRAREQKKRGRPGKRK